MIAGFRLRSFPVSGILRARNRDSRSRDAGLSTADSGRALDSRGLSLQIARDSKQELGFFRSGHGCQDFFEFLESTHRNASFLRIMAPDDPAWREPGEI